MSAREDLPNSIAELEKPDGFNAFIYIGSSKCLFRRWESHDKGLFIRELLKEKVGVDLYFYAMPPLKTNREESEEERYSRRQLERKLIQRLCPILNHEW